MGKMRTQRGGFTLVELLIVIAIIVVLMAIALPVFNRAREKAKQTACMANLHNIAMAIRMYRMDEGAYPGPYEPVIGEGGLNSLYPTYISSRETLICPDDAVRDTTTYMSLAGPERPASETDPNPFENTYQFLIQEALTYDSALADSISQMYLWMDYPAWNPAWQPPFPPDYHGPGTAFPTPGKYFSQHYSSYNSYYNYVGYAGWPETPGVASPVAKEYWLLNFNWSQWMLRGENIAAVYEWYRWDPNRHLNLGQTDTDNCFDNCRRLNRFLHLDLAQQVFWSDYWDNPENNPARLADDLGRPLWDFSPSNNPNAWDYFPDGIPSAVFPGLINRNAPDNTIVTRCPHHRAWTKTRLPRERDNATPDNPGGGQEGQGGFAYTQPTETAKDFVLRLDGSVQMIGVMGGYNWAAQSPLAH
jgi:prepilin-type N-terminal cleavage/methylation domain-containing protein